MKKIKNLLVIGIVLVLSSSVNGVIISADADGFSDGTDISNAFSGMTLSAVGRASGLDGKVYAKTDSYASTGTMSFANNLATPTLWYYASHWAPELPDDYALRIDFALPAKYLAIDMIAEGQSWGVIVTYDSSNNFISADFIQPSGHDWTDGEIVHAEINPHQSYDIAYVLVGGRYYDAGHFATPLHLDNLSAEIIPEPATILLLGLGSLALLRRPRSSK